MDRKQTIHYSTFNWFKSICSINYLKHQTTDLKQFNLFKDKKIFCKFNAIHFSLCAHEITYFSEILSVMESQVEDSVYNWGI